MNSINKSLNQFPSQLFAKNRSVFLALFSHGFQKYDVFLYGFFIPIISPLFFPADKTIASLAAFGTFAAGYLVRPIGAFFFGQFGDKFGRKQAFMLSVLLVIIPTLVVSFLPTYPQIGIWAPLSLIFCRLVQGFAAGGEFSGAAIYVAEHLPKHQQGFAGGIVRSVGFLGVALGTAIGYFMTLPMMPDFAWRLPFLIGAIISLCSFFLRRNMLETPDFLAKNAKKEKDKENNALKDLFKNHKWNLFCSLCISSNSYILLYFATIFLGTIYKQEKLLNASEIMLVNTLVLMLWAAVTFIAGIVADRVGIKKFLLSATALSALLIFPLFKIFYVEISFQNLFIFQLTLSFLGAIYLGPAPGLFKELFPTHNRFSGVSLSNTIAQAFLGSNTPMIATALIALTHNPMAPAGLLMMGCLAACFGIQKMKKEQSREFYIKEPSYGTA